MAAIRKTTVKNSVIYPNNGGGSGMNGGITISY